jgi:hypothetical protein
LLAVYVFLEIHGRPYAHVYTPEYARLGGLALDTLFHTAMSHMLQNFGHPSTGVDGLVPIRYHLLSHAWFAALGHLARSTPLYSYPAGQIGVAVPALLLGLQLSTVLLAPRPGGVATRIALASCLLLLSDRVGWNSYYISESYTCGLAILLLGLPLLFDFVRTRRRGPTGEVVRTAAMLVVILAAILAKLSVGVVLAAGFAWILLRQGGLGRRTLVAGAGLAAIAALAWGVAKAETNLAVSESFAFLQFYRKPQIIGLRRVLGFTSPLLPIVCLAWLWARRRAPGLAESERRARTLAVELVGVTLLMGLFPGVALVMWSGTAWWFANVPHWIALPLLAGAPDPAGLPVARRRALHAALAGLVLLWLVTVSADRGPVDVKNLVRWVYANSGAWSPGRSRGSGGIESVIRESIAQHGTVFPPDVLTHLRLSNGSRIAAAVARAQATPADRDLVVFVPPTNVAIWNVGIFACFKRPLVVPALTGVPMLKGLGPHCPLANHLQGYGFGDYGEASRSTDASDEELCRHALERGFGRILVLTDIDVPSANRVLDCRAPTPGPLANRTGDGRRSPSARW